MRNVSKYHFLGEGVLLNPIMGIHCSTAGRGACRGWMVVDVRGGAIKIFHFPGVINEWTLNGGITQTRIGIWSF